jgi:LacI family transcriptional regulator
MGKTRDGVGRSRDKESGVVNPRDRDRPALVRLRDIAAATGFTVNTVSRALKGKSDISAGTRRLIQAHARKMGYIPNALAASLRSGKTKTISVIIPDISDPLFAILVRDIEVRLREKNFDLFIQNTDEDDEKERRAVRATLGKKMDGVIICPCQKDQANVEILRENGVPAVLLCRRFPRGSFNYVVADDVKGGRLATEHLIARGHARIAFLNAPSCISSARERLQGYRQALARHGIRYRAELVREVKIAPGECSRVLGELLKRGTRFTSVFCFSDLMAWEAISFLQSRGMSIPGDVALVGFDDIQSRLFYPYPLTSVGYGKKRIADAAVDTLMGIIDHPSRKAGVHLVVDVDLFVRRSTAPREE